MSIVAHRKCQCEECGSAFSWQHRSRNRFCSMGCYRAYQKRNRQEFHRECRFCGVPFVTRRPEQTFCTHKCATNYDTWQGRVIVYCDGCGGITERCKSRTALPDSTSFNFCCGACCNEWRRKKIRITCRGCGEVFRIRAGQDQRQFCSKPCYQQWLQSQHASELERRVGRAIAEYGIELTAQYPLQGFIYDYAIEDRRVLIEVDGTYWHSLPRAKQRDRAKDIVAYRAGWHLIRIPEADLTANWDGAIAKAVQSL